MADKTGAEGSMKVDTDLVRKLAAMLDESDLSEIEVQDGERRIVVKRKLGNHGPAPVFQAAAPAAAPSTVAAAPASTAPPQCCDRKRVNRSAVA